jgi:AcrR family transcriptional regulator
VGSTSDQLLDAAARLFAERGIDNVSLAEIVRASEQKNASALHYHFGSRDEVLLAILARTVPLIAQRRHELLLHAADRADVESALDAIVRPITEVAGISWRERAYLVIGSELAAGQRTLTPEIEAVLAETEGHEAWALMRERCPKTPDDLWAARQEICITMIARAVAERALVLEEPTHQPVLDDDRFMANLSAMVLGAMTAPIPKS